MKRKAELGGGNFIIKYKNNKPTEMNEPVSTIE